MSSTSWGPSDKDFGALYMAVAAPADPQLENQFVVWDVPSQSLKYAVGGGGGGGSGNAQAGFVATAIGYVEVIFPTAFTSAPSVIARCRYGSNIATFVDVYNVSATNCFLQAWYRANNSSTNVAVPAGIGIDWIAVKRS